MTQRTLSEALEGLRFAMVATADPSHGGTWKARPLALAGSDEHVLRFLVGVDADWVEGLETTGSPTTVTFSDPSKNTWVALQGTARTTDDRALVSQLYNPAAGAYFDGEDDPSIRVLEVEVAYGEFWDGPSGRLGQALVLARAALGRPAGEQGDVVT
ncbi:MAG: pyridoxamine 5'-phosphate oxidase family protein [Chloroflexota bacterium]